MAGVEKRMQEFMELVPQKLGSGLWLEIKDKKTLFMGGFASFSNCPNRLINFLKRLVMPGM